VLTVWTGPGCHRDDPGELEAAARADFATGRLQDAEDRLAQLARLRPLTVPERVLRAQIAYDRGRLDEAIAALNDRWGGEPQHGPEAALLSAWRGWVEMERHHFRAAEADLKRALALEPGRAQARRQLIDLFTLQGRLADLDEHAKALSRSELMDFSYLYSWTLGQREGLDPAEQAKMLEDAAEADPQDLASRLALAESLRKLGRLDQADTVLKSLSPTDPDVRAITAHVALDQGDVASAEALLILGPKEHDHSCLAQLRGHLALLREDGPAAVKHFQVVLQAAPDSRDAQAGLGQALRLLDQPEAAAPYLKAAHNRDRLEWLVRGARPPARRSNPTVHQEIGAACLAVGRRDQARAWYQLALSQDPTNTQLQSLVSQIGNEP